MVCGAQRLPLAEGAVLAALLLIIDFKLNKIFFCLIVLCQPLFWQAIVVRWLV
jgi:hypothetical protein